MGTIIVIIVLLVIVTCAILSIRKRIKYGSACCGSHDAAPAKIRVHDKNKSHYPYTYTLTIDGMHCSNCALRVENALNSLEGIWAKVNLENKKVLVLSKNKIEGEELSKAVEAAGYTVINFSE